MKHVRALLEEVRAGADVSDERLVSAIKDLKNSEAILASTNLDGLVVIESPQTTPQHDTIMLLGEVFMILQSLVFEMNNKGALDTLHGDIAEKLMDAKQHLVKYHYEPATLGRLDALKLRPVQFKKPPEPPPSIDPNNLMGPPY